MVRITEEIKEKMIEMRKSGSTYTEICHTLGVTKERCMAYLKDIKQDRSITSALTMEWRNAERDARMILEKMGFKNIHDLNAVCSFAPSWDYLCEKNDEWWLIDVTVNGQKGIAVKSNVTVIGYKHAILHKTDAEWRLVKLELVVENKILL